MTYEIHELKMGPNRVCLLEFGDDFDPQPYLHYLTTNELERYLGFGNLRRQKEFVATRILCHAVFGYEEIKYAAHGAPYIHDHDYISISHAGQLVGFASNPDFPVGFDLELIHPKIRNLYPKFLNDEEIAQIDVNDERELIATWSLKETLYKLAGRKEILFKEELLLDKQPEGYFGKIVNPDQSYVVDLLVSQFKEFVLTTNISPLRACV